MPVPDRPVSGASIESVWGQDIHDRVFAPKGCHVHGSAASNVSTTYAGLQLDTVDSDPGGFLDAANEAVEIPTGAEGLYLLVVQYRTTTGTDGQSVLCSYALNGTPVNATTIDCLTGVAPQGTVTGIEQLVAGDVFTCQARKLASGGATPDVQVMAFRLVRIGDDYGA